MMSLSAHQCNRNAIGDAMFLSRSDDAVIRIHNHRVDPVQPPEDELNPAGELSVA